jgi:two-component system response regulator FixJ
MAMGGIQAESGIQSARAQLADKEDAERDFVALDLDRAGVPEITRTNSESSQTLDANIVHIIDNDETAGASVALSLTSAGLPTRLYPSAELFLNKFPNLKSGCIVTDIRLPGMDGLDLLRHIAARGKTVPVIVITGDGGVPLAVEAMKLGADDFFEKPLNGKRLIASIRSALEKARLADQRAMERADAIDRIGHLTPREREVLEGLVAGKPNKLIAYDLNISTRTVEIYRANVMSKMQVASLSSLMVLALRASAARI